RNRGPRLRRLQSVGSRGRDPRRRAAALRGGEQPSEDRGAMSDQGRRDPRFSATQGLQVRCESWGEFAQLYAADVSRGGMFILTDRPLPILSEIEVVLRLPAGHEVQLQATVVHVIDPEQAARENKQAGLGVQFTN